MSGLSSSLWTGVSGLMTHSKKMNVVGNNLANVSTIGFKAQRMDFNDYLYLGGASASGPIQVGAGVGVYALLGDFSQGSFESSNSASDVAIDGNGFFGVRRPNSSKIYYTRAGDFYFNADRELQTPTGLHVQGWRMDNRLKIGVREPGNPANAEGIQSESSFIGQGAPRDIVLDSWNLVPQQTTSVKFTMGLQNDPSPEGRNPIQMFQAWDANSLGHLQEDQYMTQSSIKVYDEGGLPHEITTYYNQIDTSQFLKNDGGTPEPWDDTPIFPAGYRAYEYLVTCNPEEDMRADFQVPDEPGLAVNKKKGVLMSGILVFNTAGELVQQSAYVYQPNNGKNDGPNNTSTVQGTDPADLTTYGQATLNKANWVPTAFSANGQPQFAVNFTGKSHADTVYTVRDPADAASPGLDLSTLDTSISSRSTAENGGNRNNINNRAQIIELDFGLTNTGNPSSAVNFDWIKGLDDASPYGRNQEDLTDATPAVREAVIASNSTMASIFNPVDGDVPDYSTIAFFVGGGPDGRKQDASAANKENSSMVQESKQDGYGSGLLSTYTIGTDGVISGVYDNGVTLPLYQMTMYDFHNYQGLRREGGNLYSDTRESGEPRIGSAGEAGFGEIQSYNIESSNVDMATELVQMITTQRGFQSNTKVVTTVDMMMETVIGMKR